MRRASRKRKERASFRDRLIGQRLRERRRFMGLTIGDVARLLGITQQQVHKYETGHNKISASRLVDVAVALGVSIGYFYDVFEQGAGTQRRLRSILATKESLRLVKNYWMIDDEVARSSVLELVKQTSRAGRDGLVDGEQFP